MAKKTAKTIEQTVNAEPETANDSLNEFWEKFRLSPIEHENVILTNMGWLSLITLGPLGLVVVFGTIFDILYYQKGFAAQYIISNLGDTIFTTITLSLLFGAVIISYRWYPAIRWAFVSLLQNDVIRDRKGKKLTEAEFLEFLEGYQQNLHSRKRYVLVVIFTLFILGLSFFILFSRGYIQDVSDLSGTLRLMFYLLLLPRWLLAPIAWSYIGMLWFWGLITTTKAIIDLTPRFQINVQPLHSDRAGGLKKLGDLCSYVGLFIIVVVTPSIVLAIQGTIMSARIAPCGNELQQFANGQIEMTEDRLTNCIFYANSRFNQISHADISDYVKNQLANGFTLKELATAYYNNSKDFFQRQEIFANYNIYYVMDFWLPFLIVFAFYAFIRPLLDIHNSMVEFKQRRESETNEHISVLFDKMTTLINQNNFEEADKVKSNINFLTADLNEIQKYPHWPISSLPVIRSYLSSSFLTALVTYAISLLKLSLSAEASGVLNEAIKSIFGQ